MRGRVVVFGLLTALVSGYVEPIQGYLAQRDELQRHQARLAALVDQRAEVREQIRLINTPAVLEKRARELGMVKPTERAFVVRGDLEPPMPGSDEPSPEGGLLHWLGHVI